ERNRPRNLAIAVARSCWRLCHELSFGLDRQFGGIIRPGTDPGHASQSGHRCGSGADLVAASGADGTEEALSRLPPRPDSNRRLTHMCFSATVSFTAAGLLGLTGVVTLA